jgi:hypothetical protein
LNVDNSDWPPFLQLVLDLINGAVRRHTFTQWELDLLLDLQLAPLRKSSRLDALKRYQKSAHQRQAAGCEMPQRFGEFLGSEVKRRAAASGLK